MTTSGQLLNIHKIEGISVTIQDATSENKLRGSGENRQDAKYRRQRSGIDVILVFGGVLIGSMICGIIWSSSFPFLSEPNIVTALQSIPLLAIPAIGVGILMIAGEFDLSIGSNFIFSSTVMAMMTQSGTSPFLAAIIAVAIGCAIGGLNGVVTLWLKIPSFVATLGTTGIWAAATLYVHGASTEPFPTGGIFASLTAGDIGGWVPAAFIWLGVLGIAASALLQRHKIGNHMFASGGNPQSAVATGVSVRLTKMIAFALAGGSAAVGGVLAASWVNNVTPGGSVDLPLQAIAACVIGGVSLTGGRGTIAGIIVGAALIYWIQDVLLLLGAPGFYLTAFVGGLIIVAATFYRVVSQRRIK
jgi:ribose/xylose/arabinose/galactoside ABC-type transport system permease subunit